MPIFPRRRRAATLTPVVIALIALILYPSGRSDSDLSRRSPGATSQLPSTQAERVEQIAAQQHVDAHAPHVRERKAKGASEAAASEEFAGAELHHGPSPLRAGLLSLAPLASTPSISSISPGTPTVSGADQRVTVFGSQFQAGLTVTISFPTGGSTTLSGTQIQSVSSTSFAMIATLGATGTWSIRVNNPDGGRSNTFSFNVQSASQPPSISSISPSSPTARAGDQNVSVFGGNFQSGLTVTIFFPGGGSTTLSGTQIQGVTSTSFIMVATLGVSGNWSIRVNNPGGTQSNTFSFTVQAAPAPSISSVSPATPTVNASDQNVTVSGSNFQSGLTVSITFPGGGGTTLSGTQIQSVTSNSFVMRATLSSAGSWSIRVNNPNGTQSNTFGFTVQSPTPAIMSISPSSPTVNGADQNVTVFGSNFQAGLTVSITFPGGGGTTLSGTQIQSVTSTSFVMRATLSSAGTWGIRVNNPGGTQSNTFNFTVQSLPAPSISSISPTTPQVNGADQNVTVSGSNFQQGLTVSVTFPGGGTTLNGTQIQSVTPTSFVMRATLSAAGAWTIRINNPDGRQSNTFGFNVAALAPVISSISPANPVANPADQSVTVLGSNFQAGLTVSITFPGGGGTTLSGTQIQNVTPTSFTMVATLSTAGAWTIRVNNPGGSQSNTFGFNVQPGLPPLVSSISPGTPPAAPLDQNVTVTGTNFRPNLTVTVNFPGGGSALLSGTQIQSVTPTSFVMRITLGAPGAWSIRVNNLDGTQSNTFGFTVQSVIQPPVVGSLNPSTPFVNASDQNVTVFGSNFQPNLTVGVTFPGGGTATLSGAQVQNVTPSSFVLRITLGVVGGWSMRVNNPDGGQSSVFNFNVAGGGQAPAVTSLNPTAPMTNGADQNVIVNGSNFQPGLRVDVSFPSGGIATLQGTGQIQNVTASSFLMRITLNGAGNWAIRVINPDGTQSAQFGFNVQAAAPPPSNLPTSVLSPVIGPLRVTTSNQAVADGKWEFNQYKTGFHTPTGGISLSNDTFAWDVNLYTPTSGNADAGKAVFAVADGEVISYVGTPPGGGPGAVLIAHPNAQNPTWFSGYLHMTNVRVTSNQAVSSTTVIGEIGRVAANNDHLHFVVYSGQNTRGNLQSFNVTILERAVSSANAPEISLIEPQVVNQSREPQLVTITGTNFQANSIIEVQAPNGQYFTVTPETAPATKEGVQITAVEAGSIRAQVNFAAAGTYAFSVIHRPTNPTVGGSKEGSFAISDRSSTGTTFGVSTNNTVRVVPSGRTPVILIPGIMGSRLGKRRPNGGFSELWLAGLFNDDQHRELATDVEDPTQPYKAISARNIVATEILRDVNVEGRYILKDFYGKLIDYLRNTEGYTLYDVPNPTVSACDLSKVDADLFVFPYDWRNSNFTSARDLWNYVQCIRRIRKFPADSPDFKVHIIAHSMGGLVARRYILSNPETHHVERMVTLGTPWLGAPRAINIMETGEYEGVNTVINPKVLMQIAPSIRGAHELLPSRAYDDDLDNLVLGEDGWNDFDFLPTQTRRYDFSRLKTAMNMRYLPKRPGDNGDTFHSQAGQDKWDENNLMGVDYYNFVGYSSDTLGTLFAIKDTSGKNKLSPFYTLGDGTVPLVSALRYNPNRSGLPNYRGPIKREFGFKLGHSELASDGLTFPFIGCVVNVPDADACINRKSSATSSVRSSTEPGDFIGDASYLLKVIGSQSVLISDSFGNTTDPLSTSADGGLRTVRTDVTGDDFLSASIPLDQSYKIVLRSPDTPLSVLLTKSDGQTIVQAVRYVDITLPPNVLASLEITPQGVGTLKYDSNGDGTFDTTVNPTISVSGPQAQDIEPPVVAVSETAQNGATQVALSATDAGTGVQRIMYSVDGATYHHYTAPLTLNPSQHPTVYAFADDNVANRSGLVTYQLSAAGAIQFSAATAAVNESAGRATLVVTRSGDSSGTASVDYQTADADTFTVGCADAAGAQGAAFARCDFATAVGTLTFAAGETSKTVTVPVIDDGHAEGAESFELRLSNASGATLGAFGVTTVTIQDNDAAGGQNPVAGPPHGFFVRQQYLDFLSREPDQGGFDAWVGVLNNCQPSANTGPQVQSGCDRIHVSGEGFFRSVEFQLKGGYVFRFYKAAFSRLPEYLEVVSDMSFVAGATEQEVFVRKAELAARFTARDEFTQLYGGLTNAQYVSALLGRYQLSQISTADPAAPDSAAKVTLTSTELASRLTAGTLTRAQVLRAVADSDEVGTREFNNSFVAMQYYGYLRRKPEPSGYEAWLRVLQSGDTRTMVNGFLNSAEYKLRFGHQ